MRLSPAQISFIKGIGIAVVFAVLTYLGDVAHLTGIVSAPIAAVIAALASSLEANIRAKTGSALFGAAVER